jgi:hypothetical protein
MSAVIELWCPRPPDNANARHHWRKATTLKQMLWRQMEERLRLGYHFPPPPTKPLQRARVEWTYFHPTKRFLDQDNAHFRTKPICDFLVSHGYIAGDDPAHLVNCTPEQVHDKPRTAPPLCTVRIRLIPLNETRQ